MTGAQVAQAKHDVAARLQALANSPRCVFVRPGLAAALEDLGYPLASLGAAASDPSKLDDQAQAMLSLGGASGKEDGEALYAAYLLCTLRRVYLITLKEPA